MNVQYIGDSCISFVLGESIAPEISRKVLFTYQRLKSSDTYEELGLLDLVPTYRSIAVHFAPGASSPETIEPKLTAFIEETLAGYSEGQESAGGSLINIPVIYDGDDLGRVSDIHDLTVEEVIEIHTAATYQVAMVGFRPHFPYLIGLDPRLETARLDSPRTKVPAGSVAIGGAQTGIYPEASPGGWNILGRTNPDHLKEILPGDRIVFKKSEEL